MVDRDYSGDNYKEVYEQIHLTILSIKGPWKVPTPAHGGDIDLGNDFGGGLEESAQENGK